MHKHVLDKTWVGWLLGTRGLKTWLLVALRICGRLASWFYKSSPWSLHRPRELAFCTTLFELMHLERLDQATWDVEKGS